MSFFFFPLRRPDAAGEQVDLQVAVTLGEPQRFGEIVIGGDLVVSEKRVRRWMRQEGVAEGERVVRSALAKARDRVLDELTRTGAFGIDEAQFFDLNLVDVANKLADIMASILTQKLRRETKTKR